MPVALMFDGPSLGGFVCPATITSTEIWKMGQVSANDKVRFKRLTLGTFQAHGVSCGAADPDSSGPGLLDPTI